jgi:hypothetical protein
MEESLTMRSLKKKVFHPSKPDFDPMRIQENSFFTFLT